MSNSRNKIDIAIRLTSKEREKFNLVMGELQTKCNISSKQQSQLIIQGFFELADNLISSFSTDTQTKKQHTLAELKQEFFDQLVNDLVNIPKSVVVLRKIFFAGFNEFSNDIRTISRQFNIFLKHNNILLIKLSNYTTETIPENLDLVVIHRNSDLYKQLKNLTFRSKFDINISSQTGSIDKWKNMLLTNLRRKSNHTHTMDRVEYYHLNKYLFDENLTLIKPLDIKMDLVLSEVTDLRNQKLYSQAEEVLEKEKKHIAKQKAVSVDFSVDDMMVEVEEEE